MVTSYKITGGQGLVPVADGEGPSLACHAAHHTHSQLTLLLVWLPQRPLTPRRNRRPRQQTRLLHLNQVAACLTWMQLKPPRPRLERKEHVQRQQHVRRSKPAVAKPSKVSKLRPPSGHSLRTLPTEVLRHHCAASTGPPPPSLFQGMSLVTSDSFRLEQEQAAAAAEAGATATAATGAASADPAAGNAQAASSEPSGVRTTTHQRARTIVRAAVARTTHLLDTSMQTGRVRDHGTRTRWHSTFFVWLVRW